MNTKETAKHWAIVAYGLQGATVLSASRAVLEELATDASAYENDLLCSGVYFVLGLDPIESHTLILRP